MLDGFLCKLMIDDSTKLDSLHNYDSLLIYFYVVHCFYNDANRTPEILFVKPWNEVLARCMFPTWKYETDQSFDHFLAEIGIRS